MEPEEYYLGDGAYVSFDGYSVRLRAPRFAGDHQIILEPEVLDEFLEFAGIVKRLWRAYHAGDHAAVRAIRTLLTKTAVHWGHHG